MDVGEDGQESCEEGDGVVLDCCGGEAVGDDDDDVAGCGVEERGGVGCEGAAEVWAAEVGCAVGCGAGEGEDGSGCECGDFGSQAMGEAGWGLVRL